MANLLNEQLSRINRRIVYLKERRKIIRDQIPVLEADRAWADKNASAQTWYFANVKVNNANMELKKVIQELEEMEREKTRIKMRMEMWK